MDNPRIYKDGTKIWYNEKGQYHHKDGPAAEYTNGHKEWYINGKLHRLDGPAIECADGSKEYWINGKLYNSLEEGLMDQALK